MKQTVTLLACIFSLTTFAQTMQTRTVGAFTGISSATGIEVEISQGNENKVVVSSSKDELINNIKTEIDENGVLKIFYKNKDKNWNKSKNLKLNAYITFKSISRLAASSGSSLSSTNTINAEVLNIDVSSGSKLDIDINSKDCKVDVSSGSSSKVKGSATNVKIDANSGSTFEAADLNTETCSASASSGAEIKIAVSKQLSASASSGGSVRYKGNPAIEKKSLSSGGEVKQMK